MAELIPFIKAQRSVAEWLARPNAIVGGEPPLTALRDQDPGLLAWDWVGTAATEWAFDSLLSALSKPTPPPGPSIAKRVGPGNRPTRPGPSDPNPPATKRTSPKGEPSVGHRTLEEAKALVPQARAVVDEVAKRLPTDSFAVSPETTFVSTTTPKETAVFALTVLGTPPHLSAVPFQLGFDFEDTVQTIVDAAWRFKERSEAEQVE
ncbi:hypothetical protein [Leifsonia shinshuensis]|uniref:Uncharacterized protein n=1 Tax=Leifsonia shinshuensis TaxID=150026 RepID=A0A853D2J3_9MICO|nr:hypothetical protein [Leifsonia shinshuensis]NYJ25604.1 hypothetical protein [Leifsonia shinshuensis]